MLKNNTKLVNYDSTTCYFGKYKGETFQDILEKYPWYCEWILELSDCKGQVLVFKKYLEQNKDKIQTTKDFDRKMEGGKYNGKYFSDILQNDKHYCFWVYSKYEFEFNGCMKYFYYFLQKNL